MKELIFNIADIFDSQSQSGCLSQYNAKKYHIPAYQRGYKWASSTNGAVSILLNDLWNAYDKAKNSDRKEYYLQYITVKPIKIEGDECLEVIDGQQRLTTLSIIISVITSILENSNITSGKLGYAIRDNFFNDHIYRKDDLLKLVSISWEKHIEQNVNFNKQDIFYLYSATKKSHSTFSSKPFKNNLSDFYTYLLEHVMLIVNSVESHIDSETVFRNLNSNQVPLTESELIKGLLITKMGRQSNTDHKRNFQEIVEIRSNIGKHWDELSTWSNRPDINSFYFNNHQDGMYQLLKLTAIYLDNGKQKQLKRSSSKDFPLFNFFLEYDDFSDSYQKLLEIKNKLDNCFSNNELYNLIGYNRYAKGTNHNTLEYLFDLLKLSNKNILIEKLKGDKGAILNDITLEEISYSDSPESIHQILLALNVFVEGQNELRFNFYSYEKQKWTLEHIFPQTPEGVRNVLKKEDRKAIKDFLGDALTDEIKQVLDKEERDSNEKELYQKALKENPELNSIGNMCLLTGADNSSNGNKFFNEKRENMLKLIQKGSIVPKHTFDVFSKMFEGADINNMTVWSVNDIKAHYAHINSTLGLKTNNI